MNDRIDLAIIVYSCYKNKDMWAAFSFFYRRYYSKSTCKLILATDKYEEGNYAFDDVVELDSSWAEMIKASIERAGTGYVMLFMDDYLLTDYIDEDKLREALADMECYKAQNIRLLETNVSKMEPFALNSKYMRLIPGSSYCLSTQAGIWDSSFLLRYLKDGMTAWEFERLYSMKCKDEPILLLESRAYRFPYMEAVRKGEWLNQGVKHCKKNGYWIDFSARRRMSIVKEVTAKAKGLLIKLFPELVQVVQNKLLYKS